MIVARSGGALPLANRVQKILARMQRGSHRSKIEQPDRPFERMDGPERTHPGVPDRRVALQLQQVVRRLLHQFPGFDQELFEKVLTGQASGFR